MKNCEFSDQNDLMRDRIIFDITNDHLRDRLLQESEQMLEKVVDLCWAAEANNKQTKTIHTQSDVQTDALLKKKEVPCQNGPHPPEAFTKDFSNSGSGAAKGSNFSTMVSCC